MDKSIDHDPDIAVGVSLPFRRGNMGYFEQEFTTLDQVKVNIKNLLLTMKGERPMQPTFGSDLFKTLFEPMVDGGEIEDQAQLAIEEALAEWLPYIKLESLDFTSTDDDKNHNRFRITLVFSILGDPNRFDELTFTVEGGTGD